MNSSYEKGPGIGIPIGNLTSQLFANIYLNELDQFIKHKLRIKHFLRYMDDFLILNDNKKKLHEIKKLIQEFLEDKLELELHPKKANVFPCNRGIDFLGYQIFKDYKLLRKSTVRRFTNRTKKYQKMLDKGILSEKKFNNSLQSWITYANYANSYRLKENLSKRLEINLIK